MMKSPLSTHPGRRRGFPRRLIGIGGAVLRWPKAWGWAVAMVAAAGPWWASAADAQEAVTPRQIIDDLIAQRRSAPGVSPDSEGEVESIPSRVGIPSAAVDLDPSVVGVLPGAPLPRLRREGEFVIERPGQLLEIEEDGLWVFAFDHVSGQPDLRPMIVQKCQRLHSMQQTLQQRRNQDLSFTITGQVHTHRGVNYLLPTAISGTRKLPPEAVPEKKEEAADTTGDAASGNATPVPINTETPATFAGGGNGPGVDPIEMMERMLDQQPAAPRRVNTVPTATASDAALDEALRGIKPNSDEEEKLRPEGEYLINRAGRLIRGSELNIMFAFEADGQDPEAAEPPMLVMPCKLLELMEDTVIERGDEVVFLVSGRVHVHRGANYLLPTTMRLEYDLGNLQN